MKILAGCDGSNKSDATLKKGRGQARACQANIEVVFAVA
jgi:hypothetical protein